MMSSRIDGIFKDIGIYICTLTVGRIDQSLDVNTELKLEHDWTLLDASVIIEEELGGTAFLEGIVLSSCSPLSGGIVFPIFKDDLSSTLLIIRNKLELFIGHTLCHTPPEVSQATFFLVLVDVVIFLDFQHPSRIKSIVGTNLYIITPIRIVRSVI